MTPHSDDIDPAPAEFAIFYRSTVNRTFRIACRMARGDTRVAREATQTAYARLLCDWKARELLTTEEKTRYVAGLAVRAVADADRDQADEHWNSDAAPESVREVIDSQPATRRAVAILSFLEEYPAEEIAGVLDVAEPEILADLERMRVLMKPLVDGGGP